jgi:ElaB/YqjD/DUF883 family membrane-anchored ribosome-binding protein
MKVKISRNSEEIEVTRLFIEIDNVRYRLSKTIDNRLKVNKVSIDRSDDYITIHPTSGNEVDLS